MNFNLKKNFQQNLANINPSLKLVKQVIGFTTM